MEYLNAFLCGGLLCAVGQIILDRTNLTPRPYPDGLCGGRRVFYRPWACTSIWWTGAARGPPCPSPASAIRWPKASPGPWRKKGLLGVITGGLTATSGGIAAAVVFGLPDVDFVPAQKKSVDKIPRGVYNAAVKKNTPGGIRYERMLPLAICN